MKTKLQKSLSATTYAYITSGTIGGITTSTSIGAGARSRGSSDLLGLAAIGS